MSKLYKAIRTDETTLGFAKHFKTKNSIKNLLSGIEGGKVLTELLTDEKLCDSLINYSDLAKNIDIILADVTEIYTAQVAALETNPGLPKKVLLYTDLLDIRMEKFPKIAKEIVAAMGDFAKSKDGKEIHQKISSFFENESTEKIDEVMFSALMLMLVRTSLIKAVDKDVDFGDEVIIENASHTDQTKPSSEEPKPNDETLEIVPVTIVEEESQKSKSGVSGDITKLLETLNLRSADDEFDRVVDIICKAYPDIDTKMKILVNTFDKDHKIKLGSNAQLIKSYIELMLPDKKVTTVSSVSINELIKLISVVGGETEHKSISEFAGYLFFSAMDWLINPTDSSKKLLGRNIIKMVIIVDRGVTSKIDVPSYSIMKERVNKAVEIVVPQEHRSVSQPKPATTAPRQNAVDILTDRSSSGYAIPDAYKDQIDKKFAGRYVSPMLEKKKGAPLTAADLALMGPLSIAQNYTIMS